MQEPTNTQIASVLDQIAQLLESEGENPFRVRAYREAAHTVRTYKSPIADFIRSNQFEKLKSLAHIGEGIASVIGEYVSTGQSDILQDLQGKFSPEAIIGRVPGIGEKLAHRIVEALHIETLPQLEEAAHDGRLATVEGFGQRRIQMVRATLAGMLNRSERSRMKEEDTQRRAREDQDLPSVELLLEIDAEYRMQAKAGKLPKITPRRFNPNNEAWLPLFTVKRNGWDFTVLFSNTAQAHDLHKTHDWVVIYYERNGVERQNTVVTETRGTLEGKRVVRGREQECKAFYKADIKQSA